MFIKLGNTQSGVFVAKGNSRVSPGEFKIQPYFIFVLDVVFAAVMLGIRRGMFCYLRCLLICFSFFWPRAHGRARYLGCYIMII